MNKLIICTLVFLNCIVIGQGSIENKVNDIFKSWSSEKTPGGSIIISKGDRTIFEKNYGLADLEHDIPISSKTKFYAASDSKQFVAFSILLLEEKGKLSLNDNIRTYLPELPPYEYPILIKHLIHHTSGIRDYLELIGLQGGIYLDHHTEEEVFQLICKQERLNFEPGVKFLYSNSGYFLLSKIIKEVSGLSLREFARKNIFIPLNMDNSLFYDNIYEILKNRAYSYVKHEYDDGFYNFVSRHDLVGASGLYTTAQDLSKWASNLNHNKLGAKGQNIIIKMHQEGILHDGQSCNYAFGLENHFYKGIKTVYHGGSIAGYRSLIFRVPSEDFSIILLSNRSDANLLGKAENILELYFKDRLIEDSIPVIKPKIEEEIEGIELDTEYLEEHVGYYWNSDALHSRKIYMQDSSLWYERGNGNKSKLIPIGKNEFIMEGVDLSVTVRFDKHNKGSEKMILVIDGFPPITLMKYQPEVYDSTTNSDICGTFYTNELDSKYILLTENENLVLQLGVKKYLVERLRKTTLRVKPFGIIEFDKNLKSFELSSERAKYIKFRKVE